MIKLVYCVAKRADMSLEDFREYWSTDHPPLVKRLAEALGARKYIQSHTIDTEINDAFIQSRGLEQAYDGITEVWFDSLDSLVAHAETEAGEEADRSLKEDEKKFIDLSQSRVFLTEEHVIFDQT